MTISRTYSAPLPFMRNNRLMSLLVVPATKKGRENVNGNNGNGNEDHSEESTFATADGTCTDECTPSLFQLPIRTKSCNAVTRESRYTSTANGGRHNTDHVGGGTQSTVPFTPRRHYCRRGLRLWRTTASNNINNQRMTNSSGEMTESNDSSTAPQSQLQSQALAASSNHNHKKKKKNKRCKPRVQSGTAVDGIQTRRDFQAFKARNHDFPVMILNTSFRQLMQLMQHQEQETNRQCILGW